MQLGGSAAGVAAASLALPAPAIAQGKGRVVIIGAGAGGATVAHHVKLRGGGLDVTIVEPNPVYTSCFFSNLYIGGFRSFKFITHGYQGLKGLGINFAPERAVKVDPGKRIVTLGSGKTLPYDRLVIAPGIDLVWNGIEGYSQEAAQAMPHAWLAGAQTKILRQQLLDMPDGGTVVIAPPLDPYRCPPAPYERASVIAHYLKTSKPKSKVIILDAKSRFSKMQLFLEGWKKFYPDMIEWIDPSMSGGGLARVDHQTMSVWTKGGEKIDAAVANIIPPQTAGRIARDAGCSDGKWCPVRPENFSSLKQPYIYVLGDAAMAKKMPKSAFAANSQAKVVANNILADLLGQRRFPARYRNTCWSFISVDNSIKTGASYKAGKTDIEIASSFQSDPADPPELRGINFKQSLGWYKGIISDMLAL